MATSASIAPTLVVLAAGMGSRYGGLKQVDPMGPNGEALLDYSVYDAKRAGFAKVVFIIRRDFEALFKEKVASRFEKHIDVECVFQDLNDVPGGFAVPADRQKPWGTAHATLAARHVVKEPFCVINADDYYGRESYEIMGRFLSTAGRTELPCRNAMCGFVLKPTLSIHGTVARGLCGVVDVDGALMLHSVEELTQLAPSGDKVINTEPDGSIRELTGEEYVSMNMWGFVPGIFPAFEKVFGEFLAARGQDPKAEFYIPTALDALLKSGAEQCQVLPTPSRWFGVTYQNDRPTVQAALVELHRAGVYPDKLWA